MVDFLGRFFASFLGRWFGGQDSGEIPALQMAVDVTAPEPLASVHAQTGGSASSGRADTGLFFEADPLRAVVRAEVPAPSAEVLALARKDLPRALPSIPGYDGPEAWEPAEARVFARVPGPSAEVTGTPCRQACIIYYMSLPLNEVTASVSALASVASGPPLPAAEIRAEAYGHISDDEMDDILAVIMAEEEAA